MIKMKSVLKAASKNSPTLLTVVGVGFLIGSVFKACKDTERYLDARASNELQSAAQGQEPTKTEELKIVAKCYWQTAVLTGLSVLCFVTSTKISLKRNAALVTMYGISEAQRLEYMAKTKELAGEKKEAEIRNKLAEDRVNRDPVDTEVLKMIPAGECLCYDSEFGRYFFSTSEKILAAENRLNERLFTEMYISLNDMFEALGMSSIGFGEEFGWNVNDGMIKLHRDYADNNSGVTCIVISYDVQPKHDYAKLH